MVSANRRGSIEVEVRTPQLSE